MANADQLCTLTPCDNVQVMLSRYMPVVGRTLYTVMLSWLYAYYCFDYKWSLGRWSLDQRLHHFETHWAYFAGFGFPCTLAASLLPGLVGEGVMSALFPLVRALTRVAAGDGLCVTSMV